MLVILDSVRTLALLLGLAALLAAQSAPSAQNTTSAPLLQLVTGAHSRQVLPQPFVRVAVGDSNRLEWQLLDDREILLLGRAAGRTSLVVWYEDGSVGEFAVVVQPDLLLLQRALDEIHPSLVVEMAPDREALMLRGVVPDVATSRAAEAAAWSWLGAGRSATATLAEDLEGTDDGVRFDEERQRRGRGVINLIRVTDLPPRADARLMQTLADDHDFARVEVERILAGDLPDDANDTFVLSGSVRTQVQLGRLVHLAALVLTGAAGEDDIEVLTDESGGLVGGAGQNQNNQGFGGQGGGGQQNLFAGGGNQQLGNRLQSNIGRSTSLRAGGGRILSFVEVDELPLVRVDVRLYELNLTELYNRESELSVLYGDIPQGSLEPAAAATAIQGNNAGRVGDTSPTDVQNALSFLEDGLRNQLQIVGDNAALDASFQILQTEGIARSLARPSLTVLSGERALFQVGGEVPIPQSFATNDVAQGVFNSVTFRQFGIQLDVRPLVGDDGDLTIDLNPQVATPSPELTTLVRDTTGNDQLTTGFETRSLRTSTRLRDGQVLVIGGLINRDAEWSESRAPWIADIPILGEFFKRRSQSRDELELVLVLHPTLLHDERRDADLWDFGDPDVLLRELLPPGFSTAHELSQNREPVADQRHSSHKRS